MPNSFGHEADVQFLSGLMLVLITFSSGSCSSYGRGPTFVLFS
jgi:hypothetical protein